ncbi:MULTISPECIES: DUF3102 domain-containing protein [Acinetobacter calcoaceticus/baumannii complex]|uniref:DUF3102 domain-containing protein n=1 Tax=Acinetobacter calcoaceticus/baumannii complex TaxID=909768 RepID=UPI000710CDB3|nr:MULTISPECIES: DUF3102 domain-containing protein [Acinetobacter calcoaceticus/baumannii complex]EHU3085040.1 DUF3102 domain-containing protein [Acinetobacter baumannii]EKU1345413.1 DUF3102 domain-containing protein [Acinetobacter baumannii]EKV0381026.1 DUF3102 domain-containing protein [Acinetobacter baumannii]EKW5464783.1 DUF3102 domain-containing protein [Acinetobacter baumannii]EKW9652801.1 DUF3102 domain-containing protein [Acinetobacter baumannii]
MSNEVITEVEIQNHTKAVAGLATQLGYEGALTVGALEDEIRFFQQRTVEAVMELGKRLLILKEITPHGEFNKRVEMLNFTPRMAQKFMSAVLKFSKTNSSSLLQKAGNQTKLLELVTLDDDEIQVIEQGGSIGEVSLDSIETMSVRELKDELRKIKADKEAGDLLLQKKDQKINELDAKLTKLQSPVQIKKRAESEEQLIAAKALEEANTACLTMHNDTVRFKNTVNSVLDTINEHGLYNIQEQLEALVVSAFQQIAQTSVELGIQIDFETMVNPSWLPADQEATPFDATNVEQ